MSSKYREDSIIEKSLKGDILIGVGSLSVSHTGLDLSTIQCETYTVFLQLVHSIQHGLNSFEERTSTFLQKRKRMQQRAQKPHALLRKAWILPSILQGKIIEGTQGIVQILSVRIGHSLFNSY